MIYLLIPVGAFFLFLIFNIIRMWIAFAPLIFLAMVTSFVLMLFLETWI